MNLDLGVTAAYRKLEGVLNNQFHRRKNATIERIKARREAQRQAAALELLADDARFHGVPLDSLLPSEDEQFEAEVFGEDW